MIISVIIFRNALSILKDARRELKSIDFADQSENAIPSSSGDIR